MKFGQVAVDSGMVMVTSDASLRLWRHGTQYNPERAVLDPVSGAVYRYMTHFARYDMAIYDGAKALYGGASVNELLERKVLVEKPPRRRPATYDFAGVCHALEGRKFAAIHRGGKPVAVVSLSGLGDGLYEAYGSEVRGKILVGVNFIKPSGPEKIIPAGNILVEGEEGTYGTIVFIDPAYAESRDYPASAVYIVRTGTYPVFVVVGRKAGWGERVFQLVVQLPAGAGMAMGYE